MTKNNTFAEIGEKLLKAKKIYIFPHVIMDCDSLGSGVALALGLRSLGKEADIIIEDNLAKNIKFLDKGYCINYKDIEEPADTVVCVDCGELSRFPLRTELFNKGETKICLDHHKTSEPICDFNYIDPTAAATGEVIYKLLKEMKVEFTAEIGEAIFAAITTDTGNFQYSNTTKETHLITAELAEFGTDYNKVSVSIYENESLEKIKLQGKILSNLDIFADNKAAIGIVTQEMLKDCNATMDDSEGVVAQIRAIEGIEIAILLRERQGNVVKASIRSKTNFDVTRIACKYDGGGHKKAAGCTMNGNIKDIVEILKKDVEEGFAKGY
ncbi:MAG: bifunctional oligoribonuclease/PAP phosphatase NrnA [Anaerovoracaceae bacterium]